MNARQREAADEVERILAAALEVTVRVAPATPRLSDIIAEAGSSNVAFYRYFSSKDDLMLAVMERGVGLVTSYLRHEMAKVDSPQEQISRWIRGALAQVSDVRLTKTSRAVLMQLPVGAEFDVTEPMRQLLIEPIAALGVAEPENDVNAVYGTVLDAVRRQVANASQTRAAEPDHLVAFCLNAVTPRDL